MPKDVPKEAPKGEDQSKVIAEKDTQIKYARKNLISRNYE